MEPYNSLKLAAREQAADDLAAGLGAAPPPRLPPPLGLGQRRAPLRLARQRLPAGFLIFIVSNAAAEAEADADADDVVPLVVVVTPGVVEVDEVEVEERRELVVARRRRVGTRKVLLAVLLLPEAVAAAKASLLLPLEAVEEALRLRLMRSMMVVLPTAGLLRRGLRFSLLLLDDCGREGAPVSPSSSSDEPSSVAGMSDDEKLSGSSSKLDRDSRISPIVDGFLPSLARRGLAWREAPAGCGWLLGMTVAFDPAAAEASESWLSVPAGAGGGAKMKSMSSSLPRSSMVRRNAWLRGFSATLLMRSSANRARCILANWRRFMRRRASPPSSESDRSSQLPARLRRSMPVVTSWNSLSTSFSAMARSWSLRGVSFRLGYWDNAERGDSDLRMEGSQLPLVSLVSLGLVIDNLLDRLVIVVIVAVFPVGAAKPGIFILGLLGLLLDHLAGLALLLVKRGLALLLLERSLLHGGKRVVGHGAEPELVRLVILHRLVFPIRDGSEAAAGRGGDDVGLAPQLAGPPHQRRVVLPSLGVGLGPANGECIDGRDGGFDEALAERGVVAETSVLSRLDEVGCLRQVLPLPEEGVEAVHLGLRELDLDALGLGLLRLPCRRLAVEDHVLRSFLGGLREVGVGEGRDIKGAVPIWLSSMVPAKICVSPRPAGPETGSPGMKVFVADRRTDVGTLGDSALRVDGDFGKQFKLDLLLLVLLLILLLIAIVPPQRILPALPSRLFFLSAFAASRSRSMISSASRLALATMSSTACSSRSRSSAVGTYTPRARSISR
ncbi:e0d0e794-b5a3-4315-8161-1652399a7cbb [Thermothielavioides terrestris]|uniref:E0d0e794-b5a3-4315-8161-1652399a7cbb n=1 Tax=Thermothielavioides terrestris TaxID=2587410 RepID=A0A446BEQ8_9PEZI|nr:e0d0e794-b5a3-4315-8161-1652399a7cbb [Thermothielavioides terrestris]